MTIAPVRVTRWLALTAVAASGSAPASAVRSGPPPPGARFSYQIGVAFPPAAGVRIVDRDWHDRPVTGLYNICYVNGFRAQSEEIGWWRSHHRNLLLYRKGRPVIDTGWNEQLFDTSTTGKRAALSAIVGTWMRSCAHKGFDA